MIYMNEFDVDHAVRTFSAYRTPNLAEAARVLDRLVQWTNRNSDGWTYWTPPKRAAQRLMTLLDAAVRQSYRGEVTDITEADLKKALTPIRTFLTKNGANAAAVLS